MKTRKKAREEHNPMMLVRTFLPKSLYNALKFISTERKIPMARLIAYAVDNEMTEVPVPFIYLCQLPKTDYVDLAFADEASKIANHLLKFPIGTPRDMLMLHRRDIGINSKDEFMHGYRELLHKGIIEEVAPPKSTKFEYGPGMKYVRLVKTDRQKLVERKRKAIEKLLAEVEHIEAVPQHNYTGGNDAAGTDKPTD